MFWTKRDKSPRSDKSPRTERKENHQLAYGAKSEEVLRESNSSLNSGVAAETRPLSVPRRGRSGTPPEPPARKQSLQPKAKPRKLSSPRSNGNLPAVPPRSPRNSAEPQNGHEAEHIRIARVERRMKIVYRMANGIPVTYKEGVIIGVEEETRRKGLIIPGVTATDMTPAQIERKYNYDFRVEDDVLS
eukprot:Clim_evm34s34 gene=Clim_evmTU34s34